MEIKDEYYITLKYLSKKWDTKIEHIINSMIGLYITHLMKNDGLTDEDLEQLSKSGVDFRKYKKELQGKTNG